MQDSIDPRGIVARTSQDALGRTVQTIEAYTDGVPTNDTNRTTEEQYDGSGHLVEKGLSQLGRFEGPRG